MNDIGLETALRGKSVTPAQRERIGALRVKLLKEGFELQIHTSKTWRVTASCDAEGGLDLLCPGCRLFVQTDVTIDQAVSAMRGLPLPEPTRRAIFVNRLINTVVAVYLALGVYASCIDLAFSNGLQLASAMGARWIKGPLLFAIGQDPQVTPRDYMAPLLAFVLVGIYKRYFIVRHMSNRPGRCMCAEQLLC